MILVGITLFLILIGLGFFAYGAIALSKYAFRLGTGTGLLTLLFPPYTIYFALFKLEEDGKSWPTASWVFGLVVTVLLCITFYPDLSALARGDMERFQEPEETKQASAESYEEEAAAEKEADKPEDSATAVAEEADAGATDSDAASADGADGGEAVGGEEGEKAANEAGQ